MSTRNIGFYEEISKIIFELSSNTHLISSAAGAVAQSVARPLGMQDESRMARMSGTFFGEDIKNFYIC